ncbi:dTMP kinase [Geminicoccaceae bacterium 1502E]|nr:dTMP kinase [Geminicoccaceae bacterium 1502E]
MTFEGGEGAGKTTQIARLADWLAGRGIEVVRTREPGGTEGAEAVRALLVEGEAGRWQPLAELLLVAAARADHLTRLIEPALTRGAWVLCDRYADSTRVYQGGAGGLEPALIDRLHAEIMQARVPDLTLLLDLPVATGLARRHADGNGGRFEAKGAAFHEAVRRAYLELASAEPARIAVIDAAADADAVAGAVRRAVAERLGLGAL